MSNSFIIEYPKYPEYSKNETTEKQIQKNFLFNEEDDNDNVYSYYHKFSFSHKMVDFNESYLLHNFLKYPSSL